MQINIPLLQVRRSRSDCVHEQVAKRIAMSALPNTEKLEKASAGKRQRLVIS